MVRTQIHIDATPHEVFSVLRDGDGYARWVVGAQRIRLVSEAGTRSGKAARSEPPGLLELEAHRGPFAAKVRFKVCSDQTGTTVVMEEDGADALSQLAIRIGRVLVAARNAETLWRLKQEVANPGKAGTATTETDARVALPRWLADVTARVFGLAAAGRGARGLHARGITRTGQAEL